MTTLGLRRLATAICLTCLWLTAFAGPVQAQTIPLTDLGTLGGDFIIVGGINASGQVVAASNIPGNQYQRAALWTPDYPHATTGTWTDLGALDGFISHATGINDLGVVVGSTNVPLNGPGGFHIETHAFAWVPDQPNATTGQMIDLGTLGGSVSAAFAINAADQIVGMSTVSTGASHAFLWTVDNLGTMVDLGTLGGPASEARGISADGKVVGWSETANGETHPFLWVPDTPNTTTGTMQDLGTLGGVFSQAFAVNAAGQVAGFSAFADPDAPPHAFLWAPGTSDGIPSNPQMHDLGDANTATIGFAINDNGLITGALATQTTFHSTIWVPEVPNGTIGHFVDTLSLGGTYGYGTGINALNQIAGYGPLPGDAVTHAFVTGVPGSEKFAQVITFDSLANKTIDDPDFAVTATSSSGLTVTFDGSGSCTVTNGIVHLTGTGTCTITALQGGTAFFDPAVPEQQSFDVTGSPKLPQTITFAPIPNKLVGDDNFQVSATASSGLPITFSASYDCTLDGADTVHITGVGGCTVTASQAGDSTYAAAQFGRSFLITTRPVTSTLVDIGTLGGGQVSPEKMNAMGQIAGSGYIAGNSHQHAFLWTPSAPNATTGTWTDLGLLGGVFSYARGINDLGQVVGGTNMPEVNNRNQTQAFLWTPAAPNGNTGTMVPLGALNGTGDSEATAINNLHQVVGTSPWTSDPDHEFEQHAFLWTADSGMIDLGAFGGTQSGANAISQDGKIVGWYTTQAGEYHGFLWTPITPNGTTGNMIDIGSLGGTDIGPSAVNSSGHIVGGSTLAGDVLHRAFIWTPETGKMVDLGTLGGDHAFAEDINDAGMVVGMATVGSVFHPFVWTPSTPNGTTGTMVDMLTLGGTFARGTSINNLGQISGWSNVDGDPIFAELPWGAEARNDAFVTAPPPAASQPQTISFGALANKTFGDADFGVSATASSNLTVSFGASGNCSVVGTTVHLTGAGSCTITASEAGDANYLAADDVPHGFSIAKGTATLTLGNLTQAFNGTPRPVTATTTPNGLSTVAVTYNGSSTAPTNAGSYAVVASLTNTNYQATNATGTLTITAGLKTLALNPAAVVGGNNVTGTVTLMAKAPAGGVPVALSSSNTGAATVPATVTVSANATSATFTVTTVGVGAPASTTITATWGVAKTAALTVNPAALATVTLNPATVAGGASVAGTVTLTGVAPAGGAQVQLSSSLAAARVPANIAVPAGQTSAPFTVATTAVSAAAKPVISATYLGVTKKANLTVNAPSLATVTVSPASVKGGTPSTGTVTLTGAAPAGGMVVTVSSGKGATVPASVTVAAGQTSATFSITTAAAKNNTPVTITAAIGNVKKSAVLTVTK